MTVFELQNAIIDYYDDKPDELKELLTELEDTAGFSAEDSILLVDTYTLLQHADTLETLPECLWDVVTEYRREHE